MARTKKRELTFGFKKKETAEVFQNLILRIRESLSETEDSLKSGDKIQVRGFGMHITVKRKKPLKRKRK